MGEPAWLPDLILLADFGGDWSRYLEAVYAVFRWDFIEGTAYFRGEPVRVGTQLLDLKERTFWHLTSEGDVEADRIPDLRRCERIGWVRAIIDREGDPAVWSWPNAHHRNLRQVLWLRQEDFVVIVEKRPGCWWLWTAYQTTRRHTREKLEQEYTAWQKSQRRPR
jgi:hypothetical protein